jgi:hypothetical protein
MDALGINWQYLVFQCVNFVFFPVFVVVIVFVVRLFRPDMLSKHLMDLERTPEGLVIPRVLLEGGNAFEVRKFGKSSSNLLKNWSTISRLLGKGIGRYNPPR